MSGKNHSPEAQYVEDNFTTEQRNQLKLMGVINEDDTLNVAADSRTNVRFKKAAETTIRVKEDGTSAKFACMGHVYVQAMGAKHPVFIRKYPDGTVQARTQMTGDSSWSETLPSFIDEKPRQAWAQLIRALPGYLAIINVV